MNDLLNLIYTIYTIQILTNGNSNNIAEGC